MTFPESSTSLTVFAGSWNINDNHKTLGALHQWLNPGLSNPDLVVLGFQEFDSSKDAYFENNAKTSGLWIDETISLLNRASTTGTYSLLSSSQLVGMLILVFAKDTLIQESITQVDASMVGTGLGRILGNKGAVAVRFNIGSTSFVFINSHFNAHVPNVQRRNEDFRDICQRMLFFSDVNSDIPRATVEDLLSRPSQDEDSVIQAQNEFQCARSTYTAPPVQPSTDGLTRIGDHDVIVWLGDLNYRVELDRADLMTHIAEENWGKLYAHDQLNREMAAGRVFQGFTELVPAFPPTYKFDIGTNNYDSSKKQRNPAFCDRVLWRIPTAPGYALQPSIFDSLRTLCNSDHKPVFLGFCVSFPAARFAGPERVSPQKKTGYLRSIFASYLRKHSVLVVTVTFVISFSICHLLLTSS
ncbi:hypothetical protein H696_04708 [Fonticula alba]|uniref:Inositol polyphosphate-related phosphatase domain-containing protein n=1 Tax=Fonticula alba TaxID=691883 RepID=A0A058Z2B8_FONAL|nr:hypothetical protein H696_04708 [Fonticula alba]KCV68414.1 hypothetical protein H696_04708 [Fonticula alba]|eukprot:XP_009496846.1 hypothetical protein H696_04708 [Fonticula alba]